MYRLPGAEEAILVCLCDAFDGGLAGRARIEAGSDGTSFEQAAGRAVPRSDAEREALFGEFRPVICRLLRQYPGESVPAAERETQFRGGFYELLRDYDVTRGLPLRPYLLRGLTGWMGVPNGLQKEPDSEPPCPDGPPAAPESLPAALCRLPSPHRQVVIRRYYRACSLEEIAEWLQVCPSEVRALLREGLDMLRKRLAAAGNG